MAVYRYLVHPDNTCEPITEPPPGTARFRLVGGVVELYRGATHRHRPWLRALEMLGMFFAAAVVAGAGLLALPLVITVLGAIAPVAVVCWVVDWCIKRIRR